MKALSRLRALIRNLLRPAAREREMDEELRAYVDMAVQARIAAGMGEAEARRAVAIEMGKVDTVKEEVRAVRAGAGLESLGRDLALAIRQLRRAPAFAAAVVATLALAIGANAAVFSVIQAVLLAPPVYWEPDRLMVIWSNLDLAGYKRAPLSGPELLDLREQSRSFQDIAAIWTTTAQISGEGEPEQLRVGLVTANFFSLLGVEPRLGRKFEPTEERPGRPTGRDPVGRALAAAVRRRPWSHRPNRPHGRGQRHRGRRGPARAALRLRARRERASRSPGLRALPQRSRPRPADQYYLRTVGRLAPGVSPVEAEREIAQIGVRMEAEHTEYDASGRTSSRWACRRTRWTGTAGAAHVAAARGPPAASGLRQRRQPAGWRRRAGAARADGGASRARRHAWPPGAPGHGGDPGPGFLRPPRRTRGGPGIAPPPCRAQTRGAVPLRTRAHPTRRVPRVAKSSSTRNRFTNTEVRIELVRRHHPGDRILRERPRHVGAPPRRS